MAAALFAALLWKALRLVGAVAALAAPDLLPAAFAATGADGFCCSGCFSF